MDEKKGVTRSCLAVENALWWGVMRECELDTLASFDVEWSCSGGTLFRRCDCRVSLDEVDEGRSRSEDEKDVKTRWEQKKGAIDEEGGK